MSKPSIDLYVAVEIEKYVFKNQRDFELTLKNNSKFIQALLITKSRLFI